MSMIVEGTDLVVAFDKDLKFTSHVNQIVMKANRVLGIIKRTFASRDANTIRLLYVTYSCSPNFGLCVNCLEPSSYEKHP